LVENVAHPFDPFGLSSVKKNSTGIWTGTITMTITVTIGIAITMTIRLSITMTITISISITKTITMIRNTIVIGIVGKNQSKSKRNY